MWSVRTKTYLAYGEKSCSDTKQASLDRNDEEPVSVPKIREQQLNMAPKGIRKSSEASSIFVPLSIAAKADWKLNEIFRELSLCMYSIICTEAHILQ
ncbi:putative Helicase With Zinc Finger Domain [Manis pentadactyla]|nr:putative Helicase With Zinc Finger Domain [Manis pentadactyla]